MKSYCNVVYEFETITTKLGRKISGPKGYYCELKNKAQSSGIVVENTCGCGQQYIKFLKNKNISPKILDENRSNGVKVPDENDIDTNKSKSNIIHNDKHSR